MSEVDMFLAVWAKNVYWNLKQPNLSLGQGWATPGTRAELGTQALLSGTWSRPQKQDPPPLQIKKLITYKSQYYLMKHGVCFFIFVC